MINIKEYPLSVYSRHYKNIREATVELKNKEIVSIIKNYLDDKETRADIVKTFLDKNDVTIDFEKDLYGNIDFELSNIIKEIDERPGDAVVLETHLFSFMLDLFVLIFLQKKKIFCFDNDIDFDFGKNARNFRKGNKDGFGSIFITDKKNNYFSYMNTMMNYCLFALIPNNRGILDSNLQRFVDSVFNSKIHFSNQGWNISKTGSEVELV